ncbi:tol-pal system protein YbgF [Microvirga lotononidis]|uniref:Cell division coordinator CpoB n=1 Tax=Microvirga lotononidis TaxID=864069 RepID=I4YTV3_9HYPH|nr:tol-pal system protein YbgF [Microvirga lotononidis]EIM27395.1 tol-pal system protein YbgF [Microvirga lotononidis]WQO28439.1 tol-pal system protein YbgF [Microvirga lotononidis]
MFRRLFVFSAFALALATTSVFPAAAQDAADAIVRLNRLESQFRQLSGQMEQLQYENRQLKEQLRKFQEDVEFRFQERSGGSRSATPPTATPSRPAQPAPAQPQRRSDVFDPSQAPDAPGAPRPLGTTAPSTPLTADANRPMPLPGGQLAELIEQDEQGLDGAPMDGGGHEGMTGLPQGALAERPGPSVAATSVGNPRSDFDAAYASFTQKQYDQAEMGFRRFLQSNPRDKLVPEATFWLGETYLQRGRYREAAEQFLNVTAEHPDAAKAPDSLLRLGISLNGLGAKDRACAVLAELDRKYPQASAPVRQASDREQKRIKCS